MSMVRRRRLKVKWKNVLIFLILVYLIITGLIKGTTAIYKFVTTPKKEVEKKEDINKSKEVEYVKKDETKKNEEELKKEKDEDSNKYNKTNDFDYKKLSYYKKDYLNRYIKYREKNFNLSIQQVVIDVNIGIDYPYYENVKKAKYLNKDYILVNKYNYLNKNYVPNNLKTISKSYAKDNMMMVKDAAYAFETMARDAKSEGYSIIAMSTYRSYNYQVNLYNKYVKKDGKRKADTYSGRPGYSEHQTGLAVDIYNGKVNYTSFEGTKEFTWMKNNAYKYGFILRFPKGKEKETGYEYESWHYRYVGVDIAKEIKDKNISLEEYHATNSLK